MITAIVLQVGDHRVATESECSSEDQYNKGNESANLSTQRKSGWKNHNRAGALNLTSAEIETSDSDEDGQSDRAYRTEQTPHEEIAGSNRYGNGMGTSDQIAIEKRPSSRDGFLLWIECIDHQIFVSLNWLKFSNSRANVNDIHRARLQIFVRSWLDAWTSSTDRGIIASVHEDIKNQTSNKRAKCISMMLVQLSQIFLLVISD